MKNRTKLPNVYLGFLLALMYVPILLVILYSFNESKLSSVWGGFSLKWYAELFRDRDLFQALWNSIVLGVISSCSAAVIGTLGAYGMSKVNFPLKGVVEYVSTLPMMIPEIIMGMVSMVFFSLIGIPFGMGTLVIAHTAFCIPYVFMLVKARLVGMDKSLPEAAQDLGASPVRVFFDVTLPLVAPAIASGHAAGLRHEHGRRDYQRVRHRRGHQHLAGENLQPTENRGHPGDKRPVHLAFPGHFAAVRAGRPGGQDAKKTRFWKGRDRTMKKILSMALAALLLVGTLGGCSTSGGENGQLVLYTWENMFPQEVLDGFTQETGISVTYSNFDTDETMLARLEAAEGGDYDLVIADDYIIETAIQEGLVQELDTSKLENYGSINPVYQGQFYDPENKYTVPYGAGVQTIVYDPSAVDVEIKGYTDLWDASLEDNLGIIDNFRVVNGMALKVLGESYNTEDTAAIEAAGDKLLELAPNIRLIKDQNTQDDLLSGEVGAAVLYTSQATMAKMANPDLEVVFPEEGIGFGIMAQFIPANAPNAENAYKFIDYILQPEVAAQCFEYIGYYCTNLDAEEYISEEYRDFLTLPADIDASSMEMIENVSAEALETHSRVYTEFKTACGQ